jgi:ribonuclease HI
MDKIIIYCDGACSGNQFDENIGGWGAVLKYGNKQKEIFGGKINTTNQRMELLSCIKAFESLSLYNIPTEVYSDSQYLIKGMNEWIDNWVKKGWRTSQKKIVENKDLWEQLLSFKNEFKDIKFIHVKGHMGNELNELADQLAQRGIDELR